MERGKAARWEVLLTGEVVLSLWFGKRSRRKAGIKTRGFARCVETGGSEINIRLAKRLLQHVGFWERNAMLPSSSPKMQKERTSLRHTVFRVLESRKWKNPSVVK
eukprot:3390690-Rhodomonas_salina.1